MTHEIMETRRYTQGANRARAVYRPDYDPMCPWIIYINGDAVVHRDSLMQANAYLTHRGFTLVKDEGK